MLTHDREYSTTRGLDASTALEFVRALRTATSIAKLTSIVTLYQAGETLYQEFDKVCLLYAGRMAYFGPASEAKDYFINMGYEMKNRQTTADFLTGVTDPLARIPRAIGLGDRPIPRTAEEFAQAFKACSFGEANRAEIQQFRAEFLGSNSSALAYRESAQAEHANHTRKRSPYVVSLPMQARAVVVRRWQMLKGDWLVTALNVL